MFFVYPGLVEHFHTATTTEREDHQLPVSNLYVEKYFEEKKYIVLVHFLITYVIKPA